MPLTTLQKINIAKLSQAYAAADIAKSGLYGGGCDLSLPRKIYCIRKNVEWLYNQSIQPLLTPSLTATVVSSTEIDLSWDSVLYATSYVLQRALNSTFTSGLTSIYQGALLAFSDTALTASTTYYYRVVATATGYTNSAYGYVNKTTEAAAFSPTDIADIWAWYDASEGVTGTTSVSNWADQSGNGNDLIQATSNRQPILLTGVVNSLPVIALKSGSGTQGRMKTAEVFPFVDEATIFLVASQEINGDQGDSQGVFIEYASDSEIKRNGTSDAVLSTLNADSVGGGAISDATFYLVRVVVTDGTDSELFINGVSVGSGTAFAGVAQQEFFIFQNHNLANTGSKQFAAIIPYTRALNGTEIGQVETYLNNKFNLY